MNQSSIITCSVQREHHHVISFMHRLVYESAPVRSLDDKVASEHCNALNRYTIGVNLLWNESCFNETKRSFSEIIWFFSFALNMFRNKDGKMAYYRRLMAPWYLKNIEMAVLFNKKWILFWWRREITFK